MKTVLTSSVHLRRLQAVAEVAMWEPRPELQLLCRAAEAGTMLDAEALITLVPGLSNAGARNLAAYLWKLGLCTQEGGLTRLGTSCATSGMAPAWEFGVYDFLLASHPLVGIVFLDIQRVANNFRDNDFQSMDALPAALHQSFEEVFSSVYDAKRTFSVYDFPAADQNGSCRFVELEPGELQITVSDLNTGTNEWRIQGHGDPAGTTGDGWFRSPAKTLDPGLFAGLLSRWDRHWDRHGDHLAIDFDGSVDPLGGDQFRRTMTYSNVAIRNPNGGNDVVFPTAVVEDVPVGPSSHGEAEPWATAIAVTRLANADAYATEADWRRLWEAEIAGSPAGRMLDRPLTMAEALNRGVVAMSARTRWLLSAHDDLKLE